MRENKYNIDDESLEARHSGHDSSNRWLKNLGINNMSLAGRIDFIKKTDFKKFLELISILNGKLANIDEIQRWAGQSFKKIVISSLAGENSPVYEPPDDVIDRLEIIYERMRKEINESNYKKWAHLLHHAIAFSHIFRSANGRTARKVYYLLNSPDAVERHANVENRPYNLNGEQTYLREKSLENILIRNGVGAQDDWYQFRVTKRGKPIGSSDHLKYLAAKRVLERSQKFKQQEIIDISEFNPTEVEEFQEEYRILREEWFDEIMMETEKKH